MSSDVHADVGAYVAQALEPAEREAFEAHLAGCDSCQQEVREFSETTALMSVLTASPPPPELRSSVLGAIREVRPLPPLTAASSTSEDEGADEGAAADESAARPDAAPRRTSDEVTIATPAAPVDELALRRQRRVVRLLSGLAAAAVVVALALGGWASTLNARVSQVTAAERLETELLTAPDVKVVPVQLPDGTQAAYTVSRQQDRAMFAARQLPPPEPGKAYQLWTIQLDEAGDPLVARPSEVFSGGQDLRVMFDRVRDAQAVAITVEDEGGAETPASETLFADARV